MRGLLGVSGVRLLFPVRLLSRGSVCCRRFRRFARAAAAAAAAGDGTCLWSSDCSSILL